MTEAWEAAERLGGHGHAVFDRNGSTITLSPGFLRLLGMGPAGAPNWSTIVALFDGHHQTAASEAYAALAGTPCQVQSRGRVFSLCAAQLGPQQIIVSLNSGNASLARPETRASDRAKSGAMAKREQEERRAREDRLQKLAMYDSLTSVPNRHHILGSLKMEISRGRRYRHDVCILNVDIDHFKRINDTFGHSVGDEALVHVVDVIRNTIRDYDTVGRTGGEEFLILLPETDLMGACMAAERVRSAIEASPVPSSAGPIPVTASLGVAWYKQGESIDGFIKRADEAMYQAKSTGRNRWVSEPSD